MTGPIDEKDERALAALVGDQAHAVDQDSPGGPGRRHHDLVADRLILLARVEDDPALAPGHALVGGAGEQGRAARGDAVQERAGVGVRLWCYRLVPDRVGVV